MSKSVILRVKRRLEDNPQDAFVLTCKRLKTEASPTLFVFTGTFENQDNIPVNKLLPKKNLELKPETTIHDLIKKIREEKKIISNEKRYEIINCSRGLGENAADSSAVNFVDIVKKEQDEKDVQYAYDLYTASKQDFDISMIDDLISIENYESNLVLGSYRDNGCSSALSEDEVSDDSNDENNWRNDYPDEENRSINEDDMIEAMQRCDLDDLSSDVEDEDGYKLDDETVQRYGEAYAKYKVRVLNENSLIQYAKEEPQSSSHGYGSDGDDGFYYGQEEDTTNFKQQYQEEAISSDESDPDKY